jgi:hypothetical protein
MVVSSIGVLLFREDPMACDPVVMKPSTGCKLDVIIPLLVEDTHLEDTYERLAFYKGRVRIMAFNISGSELSTVAVD